jgi:hypothetical protein
MVAVQGTLRSPNCLILTEAYLGDFKMAKEEVNMNAPEQQEATETKAQPIINKKMVTVIAKALAAQLPGSLYHNGWFYVGKNNPAYEAGKLTFVLAVEPCVSQDDVLDTWRRPLTWLLQQVKKDNTLQSKYLETYARLFRERQPGRCIYTLQFSERCLDTLDMMVAVPEGIEILDPGASNSSTPEGDGSIC